MQGLLKVFGLPAIYLFAIAAVFIYAAWFSYADIAATEASKAAAVTDGIPEPISLADFDEKIHLPKHNEVHIAASIHMDYNYTLSREGDPDSYNRRMYVLFDATATGAEKAVKSAILVDERDADIFVEWIEGRVHGEGAVGPIFHINGEAMSKADYSDIAKEAMDIENLVRQDGFFFIEPYLGGREDALKPSPDKATTVVGIFLFLAAIFALPAIIRARRGQLFRN